MFVEFFHTLSTGARIFVQAEVGEDVEIKACLSGNEPDAVLVPHELFSWKDRCGVYFAAQELANEREQEKREESA